MSIDDNRQYLLNADNSAVHDYQQLMTEAVQAVSSWLQQDQMYTGGSIQTLRQAIDLQANDQGRGTKATLQRMVDLFLDKSLRVHHPFCLAHLHCPSMVISQVAEVLINATNQSMDSWDQSPAASLMEELLIDWLRVRVGYGSGKSGVFTSGGTQSNLMGVMLARDACIDRVYQGHSVQRDGIPADAMNNVKVICSENAHFSVQKNMAMMGMGFQSVVTVATNSRGQMDVDALAKTVSQLQAEGKYVAAIVATAGTTDAGAIDPLPEITAFAKAHQIWVHVDAAWGGALILSNDFRHWLDGIEQADSITLDFHKQFFQSISCGAFLLKDPANYRFMHFEAEYLNSNYDELHGVPNLVSKSLQTTRRFDALKLWMALEALGTSHFGAMIDHGIKLTTEVATIIEADDELELLLQPQLASVLFRVKPEGFPAELLDDLNQNVADELLASGEANVGVTQVGAVKSLKMTLLNPIATVDLVAELLNRLKAKSAEIKQPIIDGCYQPAVEN